MFNNTCTIKRRLIGLLLAIFCMTVTVSVAVTAEERGTDTEELLADEIGNITMGEIQGLFMEYLDNNDISIYPGEENYYDYIVDQLLDHSDEKLMEDEQYQLFHAYMAEYKVLYEDYLHLNNYDLDSSIMNSIVADNPCIIYNDDSEKMEFLLSDSFLTTTIDDIRQEYTNENQGDDIIKPDAVDISTYSGTGGAAYALQYAESKNSSYPYYSGADCTNFVSQCLFAGGLSKDTGNNSIGIHETTTSWYCYYISSNLLGERQYSVSTSWLRVADFKSYMSMYTSHSVVSTLDELINKCSVGDVVQLADASTGVPYHTIIITGKDANTIYYSGHSSNQKNLDVKSKLNETSDNFIYYDFTE